MDKKELLKIQDFDSLLDFLVDELDWPLDIDNLGEKELTFSYSADEIGLSEDLVAKVNSIKQLRPFTTDQPWAIFWMDFETKKLPITVLRRILRHFVVKKRAADPSRATWQMEDIMFVSGHGNEETRGVTFAHFKNLDGNEVMREFSWDKQETHFENYISYLDSLKWSDNFESNHEAWSEAWRGAFTGSTREAVRSSKQLAISMAWIARDIRDRVKEVYEIETHTGALHKLYESFKEGLIHDMTVAQFADMYAQTMTYGLFSARTMDTDGQFEMHEVADLIPSTNPFLKKLFKECLDVGTDHHQIDLDELGIGRLVDLLDGLNKSDGTDVMTRILEEFGRRTGSGNEDPVIHFYEEFLKEYDQIQRVQRGVYYTPDPVVGFMVRSVNEQLKTEFGLEMGLADTTTWGEMISSERAAMPINPKTGHKFKKDSRDWNEKYKRLPFVQILDPATGTGTFLIRIITMIHDEVKSKHNRDYIQIPWLEYWNEYVDSKLFPRLYGYELMMASYSVAHMRIGMHLKSLGYNFKKEQRLNVYLTNTLESPNEMGIVDLFFSSIGQESEAAKLVKSNKFFTVVIGNPPYSINSSNLSDEQMGLIENFKYIEGVRIIERGALQLQKNLNDDYVKFFAYTKNLLRLSGTGILSFISNNNFIDGRTLRGFRWQFYHQFNKIYILNLHGDSEKQEKTPDGSIDENVFDIKKGVCISNFILNNATDKSVFSFDSFGTAGLKYSLLNQNSVNSLVFIKLFPSDPYFFFHEVDTEVWDKYFQGEKLDEIFKVFSSGIITARDKLTIDMDFELLKNRVFDISSRDDLDKIREDYNIKDDSTTWILKKAIDDLRNTGPNEKRIVPISYRPFDTRKTYYTGQVVGFYTNPRKPVMKHIIKRNDNLVLYSCKQVKSSDIYQHAFITNNIVDSCYVSNKTSETGYAFPLYLNTNNDCIKTEENSDLNNTNIKKEFVDKLEKHLQLKLGSIQSSEEFTVINILDYIYSVLHWNSFRKKYADFMKIDFPRIPYPKNKEEFFKMEKLGSELREIHMLESDLVNKFITEYTIPGSNEVTKSMTKKSPGWLASRANSEIGDVWINDEQYFSGVPIIAWNLHVGCYQPAQKWLKDRKGRCLSDEDIEHYQKIIVALTETDRVMKEIDKIEIE